MANLPPHFYIPSLTQRPHIAIVDPNTFAVLGLRAMLQNLTPYLVVDTFGSLEELEANHPERYVHFFVAMNIVLNNRDFFVEYSRKTIVLVMSFEAKMGGFHCLCVNQPESQLVRSLLNMMQGGHSHRPNLPPTKQATPEQVLSNRELEVLALIVEGHINKEIADCLHISLPTVVTHRRNIMAKLGVQSVSALTIYAVMHGYVDINKI